MFSTGMAGMLFFMAAGRKTAVIFAAILFACRLLLATDSFAVEPTALEQYLLELINRGRADPPAETDRYGLSDLNEGVAPEDTISTNAKPPLAFNSCLNTAADWHSQWMLDTDTFDHYEGGTNNTPGDRMTNAGYVFSGSWGYGENISVGGNTGPIDPALTTADRHESLFVDENVSGRGHRVNLMKDAFREVGLSALEGVYTAGNDYNVIMVTEDFAYSDSTSIPILTGVAYQDNVLADAFYTVGEGMSGVTVTAVRQSDGAATSAVTWVSGGYRLPVPAGTYDVTFSGGTMAGPATYEGVVVSGVNVKRDLVYVDSSGYAAWATDLPAGERSGTDDPDDDGASNWDEFVAGTSPTCMTSLLEMTGLASAGGLCLFWQGGTTATQVLERCANLIAGPAGWLPIFTNIPPTSVSSNYVDTTAPAGHAFYRIRALR